MPEDLGPTSDLEPHLFPSPPEWNEAQLQAIEEAKKFHSRLLTGWDKVQEALASGNRAEILRLEDLYARLETEYHKAKQGYALTAADYARCPTCPYLGQDYLADRGKYLIACDHLCQGAVPKT